MQAKITEIAPEIFRISFYIPDINMQFNQFLIRDDEPLLMHTGFKKMFPLVREAVGKILDPKSIRWIGFSHYEADECGSLNEWLETAPNSTPLCSLVGAMVSINDIALRPAKSMMEGETLSLGSKSINFLSTPHLPHCWEAGVFFEQKTKTLFSSDLFHQDGDVVALTSESIVEGARETLVQYQEGPFANYAPYTQHTQKHFGRIAALKPSTIATMHGSSFMGDGEKAIHDLAGVWKEVLLKKSEI